MPYHKGPGVKKSGPKGPRKIKGQVLDALLEEFDKHPSEPSHVIVERVRKRTGVKVSARRVREIRNERGKSRLTMRRTGAEASTPHSPYIRS
jgi:transposase